MARHCVPVSLRREIRERISFELEHRPMIMLVCLLAAAGLPVSLLAYSVAVMLS